MSPVRVVCTALLAACAACTWIPAPSGSLEETALPVDEAPDDCLEVVCDEPPDAECIGANDVVRTYAQQGTCLPDDGCVYEPLDTPCPDCAAQCLGQCDSVVCDALEYGCRDNGTCVPGTEGNPASCSYDLADDDTPCDDADPCTAPGACAGGDCVLVPIDDGEPCQDLEGYCAGGSCVECTLDDHCDDGNACTADACGGGVCTFTPLSDTPCDDGDLCTQVDACDAGVCVGADPVVCVAAGDCFDAGVCEPSTGVCSDPPSNQGTRCDDAEACTYDDVCDGAGACEGTPVLCTSTECRTETCNGTATCTVVLASTGTPCGGDCRECDSVGLCGGGCAFDEECCEPESGNNGCASACP